MGKKAKPGSFEELKQDLSFIKHSGPHHPVSWIRFWGPSLIVVLAAFGAAYYFVEPAPPDSFTMATGNPGGIYHELGLQFQAAFAKEGIEVHLAPTAGSLDNLDLLAREAASVAFVQGGITQENPPDNLEAIATSFLEPLWLFHRDGVRLNSINDIAGKRIAVGNAGSGTRSLAMLILADNFIDESRAVLLSMGEMEALEALKEGRVDGAFFVTTPESELIRRALSIPDLDLYGFRRSRAYIQRHPFLQDIVIGEGVIDLQANLPDEDRVLLAPRATIVAHEDFHPALITLLLQIAHQEGMEITLPKTNRSYPTLAYAGLPISKEAQHFFTVGPSVLQRYLPFWAATLIDRMKIMLLPLITLLIPLIKMGPPLYRWRIRVKIYRWYGVLHRIYMMNQESSSPAALESDLNNLRELEQELTHINVPLSYMTEFYELHLHIGYVKARLKDRHAYNKRQAMIEKEKAADLERKSKNSRPKKGKAKPKAKPKPKPKVKTKLKAKKKAPASATSTPKKKAAAKKKSGVRKAIAKKTAVAPSQKG